MRTGPLMIHLRGSFLLHSQISLSRFLICFQSGVGLSGPLVSRLYSRYPIWSIKGWRVKVWKARASASGRVFVFDEEFDLFLFHSIDRPLGHKGIPRIRRLTQPTLSTFNVCAMDMPEIPSTSTATCGERSLSQEQSKHHGRHAPPN